MKCFITENNLLTNKANISQHLALDQATLLFVLTGATDSILLICC